MDEFLRSLITGLIIGLSPPSAPPVYAEPPPENIMQGSGQRMPTEYTCWAQETSPYQKDPINRVLLAITTNEADHSQEIMLVIQIRNSGNRNMRQDKFDVIRTQPSRPNEMFTWTGRNKTNQSISMSGSLFVRGQSYWYYEEGYDNGELKFRSLARCDVGWSAKDMFDHPIL